MVDISEFKDGETIHLIMDDDGNMWIVDQPPPESVSRGSAVIESVDPKTNTIYFTAPISKG